MKMKRVLALILAGIMLLGAVGIAVFAADSDVVATIEEKTYTSLQAAVNASRDGVKGIIRLQKDTAETVKVITEVYLDLNGHDVAKVDAIEGELFVMDSQTADFSAKTEADYGVIQSYVGDVMACCAPEEDGTGWLMFSDNGTNASFHYVELRVTDMTLQPRTDGEDEYNPNIYYKCAFKGDEVVAQNVKTFGVALSVVDTPTIENLQRKCGYTVFENFQPGENGNSEQNSGTVLKGIMKEANPDDINERNADMPIYGRAYLELTTGEYVFGECRTRTLKEQTQKALNRWTLLNTNSEADTVKKAALKELTRKYSSVMQSWELPDLDQEYNNVVYDAATWYEEFVNLPIVNSNMSEAELRQLVVDAFRLQLSYKWTPDDNFLYLDFEDDYTTIKTGMVYEGTPYCMSKIYFDANDDGTIDDDEKTTGYGIGSSNLFKVLKYYDPAAGVLKISEMGDDRAINNILVNNCSGGLVWALGRVSNTSNLFTSNHYTPANGAIPVGRVKIDEYTYTTLDDRGEIVYTNFDALTTFSGGRNPMGQSKGDFYKSYAELQPGDVLLTSGHVRMCTGVDVVRDESGTIIQSQSYVWYIDQNSYGSTDENYTHWLNGSGFRKKYTYTQENGYTVHKLGGMIDDSVKGTKISFQDLLGAHYIPVTIPEFCTQERLVEYMAISASYFEGTDRATEWETKYAPKYKQMLQERGIEAPVVTTTSSLYTQTRLTPTKYYTLRGSYSANYLISDFRVSIVDKNGKELAVEYPHVDTGDRSHNVKVEDVRNASTLQTMEELTKYAGQGNRLKIETRLSTGQWYPVVNFEIA